MIQLYDISIQTGQFRLSNLSLTIPTGEYLVLMGRTGHGKTTILEVICGLRRPASGCVIINDVDVTHWPPGDRHVGYVPQDLALFPSMNVRQHLEFAPTLKGLPAGQKAAQTAELAFVLGIEHLLDRSVRNLSGGEAQRVALGRALASRPAVLLLDEPLSALDETTRLEMHEVLRRVKQSTGVTTIHVTHNSQEAEALADRCLLLRDGQLVTATPDVTNSSSRLPAD